LLLGVVIGKKNLSKYNILQENDHAPLIGLAEINGVKNYA
jgi:hypothetical protein